VTFGGVLASVTPAANPAIQRSATPGQRLDISA
jgi:hypothetical protein